MKNKLLLVALLAFIFAGCNHDHDTESHDEHDEAKIQLTAYSNELELFAEADPFVVGKTSNVLSHFSKLTDFHAVESGSMTIRLVVNGTEANQTLSKPTRKGIYSFDVKPEKAGKGKLIFDLKNEEGSFQVIVPEITVFGGEHEADEAAAKLIASKTNTIVFTKEQSWKIEFATALPSFEPFGQVIKTTAQVLSAQNDEVVVSAKSSGMVFFSGDNILEGVSVNNGQSLFKISGSGLADNNSTVRYVEAQNNLIKAKAEYERKKELADDKIVSDKDLLSAKTEYENSKVIFESLSANFSISGQSVTSPMSGFLKQIYVINGQYVEAGTPLFSVTKNKILMLQADVQQKYASILGSISTANIRTLHDSKSYTLEELNGKVLSFGKSTNNDNYMIPVSLQIDNIGSFVAGGFVELYLKTLSTANTISVPVTALLEEQGNYFVLVQINPELFEKREVRIGATDGIRTELINGIAKHERIVTKGAIMVKLAQASNALDPHAGHVH